jgi:hypothetical protein
MQQITIRMPKEDLQKIEMIAKSTGLKKSDITRMAVRRFIESYGAETSSYLYPKAKRLIGVAESGVPDLGLNHRRYMIERIKGSNH